MRFRGGKGLACRGGVILYYSWVVFLIMLAAEVVVLFVTDYLCFVPMTGSVAFVVVYAVMEGPETRLVGALIYAAAALLILIRHRENIMRIKAGEEAHFSILWKTDKEMKRLGRKKGDTRRTPER